MILSLITDSERYDALSRPVGEALRWLRNFNPADFTPGSTELENGIIVKFETPSLHPRESGTLEAHRKFIDIHVPLKGTEIIGWAPVSQLKHVRTPYKEDEDIAFWGDAAHSLLHVKPGQLAIFFPEDAHAPCIGLGNHRKLCIKIPVES